MKLIFWKVPLILGSSSSWSVTSLLFPHHQMQNHCHPYQMSWLDLSVP